MQGIAQEPFRQRFSGHQTGSFCRYNSACLGYWKGRGFGEYGEDYTPRGGGWKSATLPAWKGWRCGHRTLDCLVPARLSGWDGAGTVWRWYVSLSLLCQGWNFCLSSAIAAYGNMQLPIFFEYLVQHSLMLASWLAEKLVHHNDCGYFSTIARGLYEITYHTERRVFWCTENVQGQGRGQGGRGNLWRGDTR